MPLKFCANISTMFNEGGTLLSRFELAKKAGFKAVELTFPYAHSKEEVAKTKEACGLDQILINVDPGSSLGFAALVGQEKQFQESLHKAVEYCQALKCNRLHIMSGKTEQVQGSVDTLRKNLKYAIPILAANDIIGLIEPINGYSIPNYFLNDYDIAEKLVKELQSPNLRLQLDIFHLQFLRGDLTNNIKRLLPITGHIQVAQVPDRHEPDSDGEISYKYVFDLLESLDYSGWIGLEYIPKSATVEGLKWMKNMNVQ